MAVAVFLSIQHYSEMRLVEAAPAEVAPAEVALPEPVLLVQEKKNVRPDDAKKNR